MLQVAQRDTRADMPQADMPQADMPQARKTTQLGSPHGRLSGMLEAGIRQDVG